MTRSSFRFPIIESFAVLGILVGAWLMQQTFQPASDLPNRALLAIGGLDILFCFGVLGYLLRQRLRDGAGLPKGWIIAGSVLLAGFLGWIAALMIDAERLRAEETRHREFDQQLAKLEDSLRHFSAVVTAAPLIADKNAWQVSHDRYSVLHDQLQSSLRGNSAWEKDLARVHEQVQTMHKQFLTLLAESAFDQRVKGRNEFQQSRERADQLAEALRAEVAQRESELTIIHRVRWQSVGAASLTGVLLILGCILMWIVFDRELRRCWKREARLAEEEARYRSLVESQPDAVALLDAQGAIVYVNPAWKTAFGYESEILLGRRLMELIHPDDRTRVYSNQAQASIACRLSADFGIWHDVEMCMERGKQSSVVRLRELPETPDTPNPSVAQTPSASFPEDQQRIADLEAECQRLRANEDQIKLEAQQQRVLLKSHQHANSEGVLILSAQGQTLSWNPAFVRLWKLSDETMSAHTWMTIAAHMETQVESGWDEFKKATHQDTAQTDQCWQMALEGGRTFEIYARVLRDQPALLGAVQFHFRDVTRHKELETILCDHQERADDWHKRFRSHEEEKRVLETKLHEHEKQVKHLEKQLAERQELHTDLESTLRDNQDRLHRLQYGHEDNVAALKASKETARRLASGVANEFNTVLSVVLGNTDVLRENLPKDHMAQNYVDEIRQAANRGGELSQRLLAFSRNHLLQMVPVEMNEHLASLESKMHVLLGHAIELDWHAEKDELWVKTDPHPLEQALLHIVNHARQHMPESGKLIVRAKRVQLTSHDLTHHDMPPGAYVQVRLEDTGAGIDGDKLTHIFEPYHPIADGHKGDLLLATAYGILRQNGGTIEVASEPGVGTEWTILLPETQERPHGAALRVSA